jgi:hypothetical protein
MAAVQSGGNALPRRHGFISATTERSATARRRAGCLVTTYPDAAIESRGAAGSGLDLKKSHDLRREAVTAKLSAWLYRRSRSPACGDIERDPGYHNLGSQMAPNNN